MAGIWRNSRAHWKPEDLTSRFEARELRQIPAAAAIISPRFNFDLTRDDGRPRAISPAIFGWHQYART